MKKLKRDDSLKTEFAPKGVFAVLLIVTQDGKGYIRPIGGEWTNGINDAVEAAVEKHPGCKMKILVEGSWSKYLIPNGVAMEQLM